MVSVGIKAGVVRPWRVHERAVEQQGGVVGNLYGCAIGEFQRASRRVFSKSTSGFWSLTRVSWGCNWMCSVGVRPLYSPCDISVL